MTATTEAMVDSRPATRALVDAVQAGDIPATMEIVDNLTRAQLVSTTLLLAAAIDAGNPLQPPQVNGVPRTVAQTISQISVQAAATCGVDLAEVFARGRDRGSVLARQLTWTVAFWLDISAADCGRVFDRDHTTILAGIKRVQADEGLSKVAHSITHRVAGGRRG